MDRVIEALLASSPLALALCALILLIGVAYKTVPVLSQAARFSLKDSSSQWADRSRVEQVATRLHEIAQVAHRVEPLERRVDQLGRDVRIDVSALYKRIDDHIGEDVRVHSQEAVIASERAERLGRIEAAVDSVPDLIANVRSEIRDIRTGQAVLVEDVKQILTNMSRRRTD